MEIYLDNSATTRCYESAAKLMYELDDGGIMATPLPCTRGAWRAEPVPEERPRS